MEIDNKSAEVLIRYQLEEILLGYYAGDIVDAALIYRQPRVFHPVL